MQVISAFICRGMNNVFPSGESADHRSLPAFGQKMHRRQHHMMFKWEAAVGSLYPVTSSDARNLACKQPLIVARADVFYDRVTEYDVECSIREGKHSAICAYKVGVLPMGREGGRHIEDRELRPAP